MLQTHQYIPHMPFSLNFIVLEFSYNIYYYLIGYFSIFFYLVFWWPVVMGLIQVIPAHLVNSDGKYCLKSFI